MGITLAITTQCHRWMGFGLFAMLLSGCSGGGSNSSPTPPPTTVDMGTLTAVSADSQFKIENVVSSMVLGIANQSQAAGANVVQGTDSGLTGALWHFLPNANSQFNIENLLTHQVMGVQNGSASAGALVLQWGDSGTRSSLVDISSSDGNYLIKNVNSGLYLEDANSGLALRPRSTRARAPPPATAAPVRNGS